MTRAELDAMWDRLNAAWAQLLQRPPRSMPLPRCAFCGRKEMIGLIRCADGVMRRACPDCWELLAAYGGA